MIIEKRRKEFSIMKYFVAFVMVVALALACPSASNAQHKWMPGMIYNGYILCQDGMGRLAANPSALGIPWEQVVGGQNRNTKVTPSINAMPPKNPVSKDIAVVSSVSAGSTETKSAADLKAELKLTDNKNCPPGWVPAFGECPKEKWNPWDREKAPYHLRGPIVPYRFSRPQNKYEGIVVYKKDEPAE
jgi:hypothetical protein